MNTVANERNKLIKWLLIIIAVMLLLVAFFIFTTSVSKPTAMKFFIPKNGDKQIKSNDIKGPAVLTLLLAKNNAIYYYEGELTHDASTVKSSNFTDIGKVLRDKKQVTDEKEFTVMIKVSTEATYKNTVDILDQMTINDVKRYEVVDISPVEMEIINRR